MRSVELFAGAGGLAMGISGAGFSPQAVVEYDAGTCSTLRGNHNAGVQPIAHWPLNWLNCDVRDMDYSVFHEPIDLVAGGPPCQPFSLGGNHLGFKDERNMFPEAVRAVRELRPQAFMFENVKGLLRSSFKTYFEYIKLQLTYPEVIQRPAETWNDHLARLEQHHTRGGRELYRVVARLLNAADYGIPQRRERVIIVGFRADLASEWSFPEPTHSAEALLWEKWVSDDYWQRHEVARRDRPQVPAKLRPHVERLSSMLFSPAQPWRTVRDAFADLPDPETDPEAAAIPNHRYNPGARAYPGHTGSPLDEPAKTLKAGDHGVPGGENMLTKPDGSVRYFTVRESARLQTFPDTYILPCSWTESMRQLGNAVPVELGQMIATSIRAKLRPLAL